MFSQCFHSVFTKFALPIKMNCTSTESLPILYIMIMFDNEWMLDLQSTLALSPQMRSQENSVNCCAHSKATAPGEILKIFAISKIGVHIPRLLHLVKYSKYLQYINCCAHSKAAAPGEIFKIFAISKIGVHNPRHLQLVKYSKHLQNLKLVCTFQG